MTAGAPDFQGYSTWTGAPLGGSTAVSLPPGVTTLFSGPVTNFASLLAIAVPTAGQGHLIFNWYADAGLTELADTYFVRVNASAGFKALVPVEAQYVQVQFSNTGGVTVTGTVSVAGSNVQAQSITYPGLGLAFFHPAQTITHGTTAKFTMNQVIAGAGQLSLTPADSSGKLAVKIVAVDEAGAVLGTHTDAGSPTAGVNLAVNLPNEILQVQVANSDTADHVIDLSLWCAGKG